MANPQDAQKQIEELKSQFEFSSQMQKAAQDSQTALIEALRDLIKSSQKKSGMTRKDLLTMIMPALTTIAALVIGYFIWQGQNETQQRNWLNQQKIQQDNSLSDKKLATRFALTEEFYKRKLDAYEDINKQLTSLLESFERNGLDGTANKDFADRLELLKSASATRRMYISNEIVEGVDEIWVGAIESSQKNEPYPVQSAVDGVGATMRSEVESLIDTLTPDTANRLNVREK
jgi:hypothetical protein